MKDRLPPHALESEKAIIGSCLMVPNECVPIAQLTIKDVDFFYDHGCRVVWSAICEIEVSKLNLITLSQKLKEGTDEQKSIGIPFLNECMDLVPSVAQLPVWIDEVQSKKIARDILQECSRTVGAIYENADPLETLEFFESRVLAIRPSVQKSKNIKALVSDAIDIMEVRAKNWELVTGLSTGINALDRMTDGMHGGEFIVIGAPTSCGKTAMALGIVMHNALAKIPAAFASAEMQPVRLVIRGLCSESRVNFKQISETDVARLMNATGRIANAPLHIESVNGFTIGQVRALARRLKQQYDIKLFAVENIQLLLGQGDNREQRIANISAGLKGIALELDIPVIGLSQLNDDDRLRESRAISHDADTIWIIKNDGDWVHDVQPVVLNVEKCRDGETGSLPLKFYKTFTKFEQQSKFANEDVPDGR